MAGLGCVATEGPDDDADDGEADHSAAGGLGTRDAVGVAAAVGPGEPADRRTGASGAEAPRASAGVDSDEEAAADVDVETNAMVPTTAVPVATDTLIAIAANAP